MRIEEKRFKILIAVLAILFLLVGFFYFLTVENKEAGLKVYFFDVGQGDSILIQTPQKHNILIDGGPDGKTIGKIKRSLPWWDRTIDLMILTHPHEDHVAGLLDVVKGYKIERIMYTGVVHNSPVYLEWLKLVREKKIPLILIDSPQKIVLGPKCDLDIFYPNKPLSGQAVKNVNNSSIVGMLECEQKKILLAGDIEKEIEDLLLESKTDLKADIYKASHHGSNTSNTKKFLDQVKPEIVVVSVGTENKFGHPSPDVLSEIIRSGAIVYRTDIDKDIILEIQQGKIKKK